MGGSPVIDALADGGSLFLVHLNADPDAIAAAYALREAFGGAVGASGGVSAAGNRLAARVGLAVDPLPWPEKFKRVVAVDTSSRVQLGPFADRAPALYVVDHHAYGDLLDVAVGTYRDPSRASCAEVALALLDEAGRPLTREMALALLTGIVADTARFRHADPRALADAARLMREHALKMGDALAILETEADEEEGEDLPRRLANLKAAERALVRDVNGFLLATSRVGAYEASAALGLLRLGADLAVVLAEKSDRARVSLRASPRLLARGVHLGEVANRVGREIGWSGGGHEGAAGLNGPPPGERAVKAIEAAIAEAVARAREASP